MKLKIFIKQYLCEHKNTTIIHRIITEDQRLNKVEGKEVWDSIKWTYLKWFVVCNDCGKKYTKTFKNTN